LFMDLDLLKWPIGMLRPYNTCVELFLSDG
jgi:hypothetical protein